MIGNPYVAQLPMPCNESLPTGRLRETIQEGFSICNVYSMIT